MKLNKLIIISSIVLIAIGLTIGLIITMLLICPFNLSSRLQPNDNSAEIKIVLSPVLEFGTQPEDTFLWNIQQLESSGGKYIFHKYHNQEKAAIGKWGLKRPTINEMINRYRQQLPKSILLLSHMSYSQIHQYFQMRPDIELEIARLLARHLMMKHQGNATKMAYAWRFGHNLSPFRITKNHLKNSNYVRKFKRLNSINPFNK